MKRLAYLAPLLLLPLTFACGDSSGENTNTSLPTGDDTTTTGEDTESITLTTPSDTSMSGSPTSEPTATMTTMTATDPDTTATDSEGGCTEADECIMDGDCLPGQTCVACICAGEPEGCQEWGEGIYGACLDPDVDCGGLNPGCVVDSVANPTHGVCFFPDCGDICDCPEPPEGFEDQVECGALVNDSGDCFISCSEDGDVCPEGMNCIGNFFCAPPDPAAMQGTGYDDCQNEQFICPNAGNGGGGFCLQVPEPVDMATGAGGVCSTFNCDDADDCPAVPATGDAVVVCADATGDGDPNCTLDCSGATCPDGMVCHNEFDVCYFETLFNDPYGECVEGLTCPPGPMDEPSNCLGDFPDPTFSFCTHDCTVVADCHPVPPGGDAPLVCVDILGDGQPLCAIDCSGGETCPTGFNCQGGFCANDVP